MQKGGSPSGRKHVLDVLIAHGVPSVRRQLKEVIEKLKDVRVLCETANGAETLLQALELNPDLVILAGEMPDQSLLRLTRLIKAKRPKTRVIVPTDGKATRDEALGAGVDGLFEDHKSLRELVQKIHANVKHPMPASRVKDHEPFDWRDHKLGVGIGAGLGVVLLLSLIFFPRVAFPAVALAFGLLSFLYGLKYYMSVALILSATSAGPNGNGNGNGLNGVFNGLGAINGIKKRPETMGRSFPRRVIDRLWRFITRQPPEKNNNNGMNNRAKNGIANGNGYRFKPDEQPFISIHLPLYNESRVVERLLQACTRMEYQNYEVLVADDSTDETIGHLEKWAKHPKVKVSHRINRTGFKGAALQHAMEVMDPRTQYIAVFDADFIPPPDVLHQFLSYFYGVNGDNGYDNNVGGELRLIDESLAVVQGYQWHILNASENWITRGIRTEFSGSYVVERPGQEVTGAMKMISGSVFMIRADLLRKIGWGTSITEDWELTLRLYLDGYRVLYSPFIQAPAECVSDFKQLARQRMRWAEGHTYNVKRYFLDVLSSRRLTRREKLEFIYYAPFYMQSVFFIIGTLAWIGSETFLNTSLPFWTETLGWSLVFSNIFALIAMNTAGLFLERGVRRNISGLFSFVLLTFLLVPYQAYAAVKGLIEPYEGAWHRTDKTGVITEVIDKLTLGKRMKRLLPRRKKRRFVDLGKRLGLLIEKRAQKLPKPLQGLPKWAGIAAQAASVLLFGLILLAAFNAKLDNMETPSMNDYAWGLGLLLLVPFVPAVVSAIKPHKRVTMRLISIFLASCIVTGIFTTDVLEVAAAPTLDVDNSTTFWWYDDTSPLQYMMYQSQPTGAETSTAPNMILYSDTWPSGYQLNSGTSTVYFYVQCTGSKIVYLELFYGSGATWTSLGTGQWSGKASSITLVSASFATSAHTFSTGERLRLDVSPNNNSTVYWDGIYNDSRLVTPTIVVPEGVIALVVGVAVIPLMIRSIRRKRERRLHAGWELKLE
jgi:cellulose synthase/poly-beta-1,6-N-acetylglucosamine synthase-like glycosyltransferase/CheY-like chemotaxis protein